MTDPGNIIVVVEHNLDVIKTADWILDPGPEVGNAGGYLIAQGTPVPVAQSGESYFRTASLLKQAEARSVAPIASTKD